jgi:hypothetical protein
MVIIIIIIISTGPVPGGERLERGVWREEEGVPSLRCRGSPRLPSSPSSRGGHHQQLRVFGIGTFLHHHTAKTKYRNFETIFPKKEYRGLSPNFHIHASVSDLYIPTFGLPTLLEEICEPILGLYKSLTGAEAALFPEKE